MFFQGPKGNANQAWKKIRDWTWPGGRGLLFADYANNNKGTAVGSVEEEQVLSASIAVVA